MDTMTIEDGRDLPIFIHSELDDLPLTLEAFRVYAHLARRAGRSNTAWPSYNSIAEACFRKSYPNASQETLRRKAIAAVKELTEAGLIEKVLNRHETGEHGTNTYRLTPRHKWGGSVNTLPSVNTLGGSVNALGSVNAPKGTPYKDTTTTTTTDEPHLPPTASVALRGGGGFPATTTAAPTPKVEDKAATDYKKVVAAYEGDFGLLSPTIGEILADMVTDYGATWVIDAIKVAAMANRRSLNYVQGVLRRWRANGYTPPGTPKGGGNTTTWAAAFDTQDVPEYMRELANGD